ncbi:hypothetical protein CPC08DRAFT_69425 [Agrocybe pediades]|nr:hypothetical protein CPC08DRAFT_69425 [Agrocybe pediades]
MGGTPLALPIRVSFIVAPTPPFLRVPKMELLRGTMTLFPITPCRSVRFLIWMVHCSSFSSSGILIVFSPCLLLHPGSLGPKAGYVCKIVQLSFPPPPLSPRCARLRWHSRALTCSYPSSFYHADPSHIHFHGSFWHSLCSPLRLIIIILPS